MRDILHNPFTPGAGHMPPYLAGREHQITLFRKLIQQSTIFENLLLTGLRGVGKTVLLESLKPVALQNNWLWVGSDLSESASVSEETVAQKILADVSLASASLIFQQSMKQGVGFSSTAVVENQPFDYRALRHIYDNTPGLIADKIKTALILVWKAMSQQTPDRKGIIFAYDEAQTMRDHAQENQYPLSMLLDVFQSIQKSGIPFMLALTGLPTLFPKLIEARTYAERMFHIVSLSVLSKDECKDAITKPIEKVARAPLYFTEHSVDTIINHSGGYPYFIQFICREVYDVWINTLGDGTAIEPIPPVPMEGIIQKLDADFFAGRWARLTDRQRELLRVIAHIDSSDGEFSVQEVVGKSKEILSNPFGASHANQMLAALSKNGLIYKNRHGKYSFAMPLMAQFVLRQE